MLKVAITGNIACGKSTLEKALIAKGYKVFDTDKIAHRILEANLDVQRIFNTNDRKELAKIVFSDKEKMRKLESIIHPLVKNEVENIFKQNNEIVFVSVPQLFEAGFELMFDKIIYVYANEDLRLERLMRRNNLTLEDAKIRIRAQESDVVKMKESHFIIENENTFEEFEQKIDELILKLTN